MTIRPRKSTKRKKKKLSRFSWWVLFLPLFLLIPFYYGAIYSQVLNAFQWFSTPFSDQNYPRYDSYDIRIPKGYKIHGIDVSWYQGKIDWKRVSTMEDRDVKIQFAFIKATEGIFKADPTFIRNWKESNQAGIIRGAYHYYKPEKSGYWQARFFLQTVNFRSGDILPVVDVEERGEKSRKEFQANLTSFLVEIEKAIGAKPIIYSGYKFYEDNLAGDFAGYPLWIAHYHRPKLKVLSEKQRWNFWQHSDKTRVNGIRHKVDMNVFNGGIDDFTKILIQ